VALGSAAIFVLFLSFAIAGLDVVLTGNPLELIEDEFGTFVALVSLLKLLIPLLLLADSDIFEIIVLLSAVSLVVVALGSAAIPVLFFSLGLAVVFAITGLAVVFAITGLAAVFAITGLAAVFAIAGNPLELLEDEFRTFAALVNVARRIIKTIDTTTTAINGI
jgi:hypothetical protein